MKEFLKATKEKFLILFNKNKFVSYTVIILGIVLIVLNIFYNFIGYLLTIFFIYGLFSFSQQQQNSEEDILMTDKNTNRRKLQKEISELEEFIFLNPHNKEASEKLRKTIQDLEQI